MTQTVFSNGRKTFDTRTEGENLRLEGQATIGTDSANFYGQIIRRDNGNYVGDYSQNNISIADPANYGLMTEISPLWVQLGADITAKKEEEEA